MWALCCRSQVASHPAASSGCRPALTMPKSSSQRAKAGEGLCTRSPAAALRSSSSTGVLRRALRCHLRHHA
eukprot:1100597-Lingulodinium_polyedra.AAC.1